MNKPAMKKLIARLRSIQRDKTQRGRFNMQHWGIGTDNAQNVLENPVCNTQACLAGETLLAFKAARTTFPGGLEIIPSKYNTQNLVYVSGAPIIAIGILGLTDAEAKKLFYFKTMAPTSMSKAKLKHYGWPEFFEKAYNEAKTPEDRLEVAIARCETFLVTNGEV